MPTNTATRVRMIEHLAKAAIDAAVRSGCEARLPFAGSMAMVRDALRAIDGTEEEYQTYCALLDSAGEPYASQLTATNIASCPGARRG